MTPEDECYDCTKARDELDAFVRGDLPIDVAERMQQHLDACGHCTSVARFEQAFRERLRQAGRADCCPPALRDKIRQVLDQARPGD